MRTGTDTALNVKGGKMPSLLDQVLQNKDNPSADSLLSPIDDQPHQLPDGATIYDSTIAAINRILELNPHLHKRATGIASQPYQLYNGHTPIDPTDKKTLLSLLRADWEPRTHYQLVFLVDKLTELAPTFSRGCIFIPPDLLWDRESGTLKQMSEDELKNLRTVS